MTIATDIKPFAVWGGPILTTSFADELAARHVLCIDCGDGDTNSYFQQRSPYVWSLGMLPQQSIVHVTEFLKKQVNGKDATFAGESDFTKQKRKFGMIDLVNGADSATLLTDWQKSFSSAGINVAQYVTYASPTDLQTQAPALIAKLKAAGVTSVIFVGRSHRAPGADPRRDGPELLPRVDHLRLGADRHRRLRPDLRPAAVGARLRCVLRCGPHRGDRCHHPVRVVLRPQAARPDRRGRLGHRRRVRSTPSSRESDLT